MEHAALDVHKVIVQCLLDGLRGLVGCFLLLHRTVRFGLQQRVFLSKDGDFGVQSVHLRRNTFGHDRGGGFRSQVRQREGGSRVQRIEIFHDFLGGKFSFLVGPEWLGRPPPCVVVVVIILLTMARGRKLLLPSLTSLSVLDMRWRSLSRTVHNRAMGILLGSIGAVSVLACQGAFSNAPEGSEALVTQDLPSASTHFRRLTHVEWENTVQDLFGLSAPSLLSAAFRNDPRQGEPQARRRLRAEVIQSGLFGSRHELLVSWAAVTDAVPLDAGLGVVAVGRDLHRGSRSMLIEPTETAHELGSPTVPPEFQVVLFDRVNAEFAGFAAPNPLRPNVAA